MQPLETSSSVTQSPLIVTGSPMDQALGGIRECTPKSEVPSGHRQFGDDFTNGRFSTLNTSASAASTGHQRQLLQQQVTPAGGCAFDPIGIRPSSPTPATRSLHHSHNHNHRHVVSDIKRTRSPVPPPSPTARLRTEDAQKSIGAEDVLRYPAQQEKDMLHARISDAWRDYARKSILGSAELPSSSAAIPFASRAALQEIEAYVWCSLMPDVMGGDPEADAAWAVKMVNDAFDS